MWRAKLLAPRRSLAGDVRFEFLHIAPSSALTLLNPGHRASGGGKGDAMSSQEAICVRFPSGNTEYTFTSATPSVGDRVKRGDNEWEVVAIGLDANEHMVVTLGAPGDGALRTKAAAAATM